METPKSKLARKRRATKLSSSKTYSSPRHGTPPKSSCSTPLVSYQSQDNDLSQSNFEQESCSPILLTQQGSRGDMDVVWDWNSPQRHSSNRRPSKKIIRRSRKVIAASPLVQRPVSRKTSEIEIKGFAKLQEELLAIKHKIQPGGNGTSTFQSQISCTSYQDTTVTHHRSAETRNQNLVDVKKLERDIIHFDDSETDLLFLDVDIPEDNKYNMCNNNDAPKHDVNTSVSFSDFFKDDSFIEACMYQCSQQAENEYLKQKSSIVNSGPTDLNKNSLESKQCDTFNNDNIRILQNKSPVLDINSKSKQSENYDSLDYILSAYPDNNFCKIGEDLNTRSNNKQKCSTTSIHSVNNKQNKFTPEMTSSSLNQVNTVNKNSFNINKPTTLIDNNKIIVKPFANNSNKNTMLSLCKPPPIIQPVVSVNAACSSLYGSSGSSKNGLSRHNSMPVPVPGQARNVLGRHNSMPISPQKGFKHKLSSERTGSVDSIDSQSCSPLQCTPDEIEKKRQDARKRLEARQQQSELERKRQEAINRLQRNNPTKTLGICLHQKKTF